MADLGAVPEDELLEGEYDDLPEFANDENRALHRQVRAKETKLKAVEAELSETQERITVMKEHLKSVTNEQLHTQRLVDAKVKEISTEDHLKQLAERESGRFHAEFKKLQGEIAELEDKVNLLQNGIFKGNEQMEQFKLQMNWNQDELEQWALAARQKEEDNLALLKYTKADESKMKELSLQLEKMMDAEGKKKAQLEEEVTKTQANQIELDKTAEDFRALHKERQELVVQWEAAVQAMQKRDEAIKESHEEFAAVKGVLREKQEALHERDAFLQTERKNNAELDLKIAGHERTIGKKRELAIMEAQRVDVLVEQVETQRAVLSKAATEMGKAKAESAQATQDVVVVKEKLEKARQKLLAAEQMLDASQKNVSDGERAAKQMEEYAVAEVQRDRAAEKELQVLKERMFKESQKLFGVRQRESELTAELSGAKRVSTLMAQRVKRLDEEAQRSKELVYTSDFQLQLMERKVARASGVRSAVEQAELHKRIALLEAQAEKEKAQVSMLDRQTKRLANDLKAAKLKGATLEKERTKAEEAVAELEMKNDAGTRHLKEVIKNEEEQMVAHDVLKLELKRLRESLNAKADEVFGLQNRKFQLQVRRARPLRPCDARGDALHFETHPSRPTPPQMSMEEREQEVKVHGDVLRAQLKAAEEERAAAGKELSERLIRAERLNNKYEIICGRMGGDGGDDGEHTQAYYVIKAAQEREELQRQGDELDQQIQKSEREIRALEKTLSHLYSKNAGCARDAPRARTAPQLTRRLLPLQVQGGLHSC